MPHVCAWKRSVLSTMERTGRGRDQVLGPEQASLSLSWSSTRVFLCPSLGWGFTALEVDQFQIHSVGDLTFSLFFFTFLSHVFVETCLPTLRGSEAVFSLRIPLTFLEEKGDNSHSAYRESECGPALWLCG